MNVLLLLDVMVDRKESQVEVSTIISKLHSDISITGSSNVNDV
jgi:hypothetical protein